jgi:hypothetical protein
VVAALSVSFRTPGLGWHNSVDRWVTMFDRGEGGNLARGRLQKMAKHGSRVWHLDPPDGRDDPGDSSQPELAARLSEVVGKPFVWV